MSQTGTAASLWRTRLWATAVLVVLAALALALRLPELGTRMIHADESVHAVRYQQVLEGHYVYDPNEFHGPTLYYASQVILALADGKPYADLDIADYRLVTVVFGVLLVLLAPLAMPGQSALAVLAAGSLLALSPVLTYYSRYYIQEVLLAAFSLAFLGASYRAVRDTSSVWTIVAAVAAGLMIGTKETAVMTFAAAALGLWLCRLGDDKASPERRLSPLLVAAAVLLALALGYVLLSAFFTAPSAPLAFADSVKIWGQRATSGEMHPHPWYYYLRLVSYASMRGGFYSEGLILVLALLALLLAGRRSAWVRYMAVYCLGLFVLYSVIPYKTPWCAVQMIAPLCLLAGRGAEAVLLLVRRWWWQLPIAALLLAALVHLGWQSQRLNHRLLQDRRNPYSHTLTAPDAEDLTDTVQAVAKTLPRGLKTQVLGLNVDTFYWPLPWYLRRMPNVGWFDHVPSRAELGGPLSAAPILIASTRFRPELKPQLESNHELAGTYGLRSRVFFDLWVNKTAWDKYLATPRGPDLDEGD